MKVWYIGICSALFGLFSMTAFAADTLSAGTLVQTPPSSVPAVQKETVDSKANVSPSVIVDPAIQMTHLEKYYITSGKVYTESTDLLESLPKDKTLLSSKANHYFRMDKQLTGDFFYHISAYNKDSHILEGSYFVAKDQSCAWRLQENSDAVLLYGNGESLLDKTKVVFYPKRMSVGSYGIIRVHVPGMVPYDIKITSLNTEVAQVTDKMNIHPLRQGKADIVVDIQVAGASRTFTEQIDVIDEADKSDTSDNSHNPSIGIGIGIGWGGGWHHHDGGIGIGIGPWW
jgi:hypothetical protein